MSHDASPPHHDTVDDASAPSGAHADAAGFAYQQQQSALEALAAELIAARKARGLSQSGAARLARIGRATLVRWENAEQPPTEELLERLRAVYRGEVASLPHETDDEDDEHFVRIDRIAFGRILGRLETTREWVSSMDEQVNALAATSHGVGDSLRALQGALDRISGGVAGLVDEHFAPLAVGDLVRRAGQAITDAAARTVDGARAAPEATPPEAAPPAPAARRGSPRGRRAS